VTAGIGDFNDSYKHIFRSEKKKPRLGPHKGWKTHLRQGRKRVERPRMIPIGIVKAYAAITVYREGYRVEMCMNDGVIMMVIRVFAVVRAQMHVLVRRHKERQHQRGTHR